MGQNIDDVMLYMMCFKLALENTKFNIKNPDSDKLIKNEIVKYCQICFEMRDKILGVEDEENRI